MTLVDKFVICMGYIFSKILILDFHCHFSVRLGLNIMSLELLLKINRSVILNVTNL